MKRIILSNNNLVVGAFLFFSFLLCWSTVCQGQAAVGKGTNQINSTNYVCVQRGPNSKVWQQMLLSTNETGDVTTNVQSYNELATGICYLSNGEYVDSVEEVDPVAGGAQAVQGRHQVQWALNANTPGGAVTIITPDAKQLSSTVFGLAYYDAASGSNVAIGQLKDCNGSIVAPNQVLYANAFSNVTADVLYTYTKAGLSQDIVLRQAPPAPDSYGLSDDSTILQIYTEFLNPPQPAMSAVTNGNVVDDQVLDFGEMKMGVGQAFFLNSQNASVSAGVVAKQWVVINNRNFLIESIPYSSITNQLQQLPHASNLKPGRGSVRRMAFLEPTPSGPKRTAKSSMKLAMAETTQSRLKIDYELLSGSANLTLQGDTTYFVSGAVNVTGTTTIEGGTVVKYTNTSSAGITTTNIVCLTGPYSPGVFTSMNDNSVGSPISGSTGSPTQNLATYLTISMYKTNSSLFNDLRFSYASNAVLQSTFGGVRDFWSCQFLNCGTVIGEVGADPDTDNFHNVLISHCQNVANSTEGDTPSLSLNGEQITVDQVVVMATNFSSPTLKATNSVFTSVTNWGATISLYYCATNSSSSGFYTNVGAGGYYLAAGSTNRDVGTANIDPVLLTDLRGLTTYPPVVVTNAWLTQNTNFSTQVLRDTGTPDLGYHYPPIDYAISASVSNATVTVSPGIVLAGYGASNGLALYTNATFTCQGTAINPVYFVRYNAVQEQSNTNWESANWNALMVGPAGPDASLGSFAFTDWSVMGGEMMYFSTLGDCPLRLQNCQLWGGVLSMYGTGFFSTNCLYGRVFLALFNHTTSLGVNATNTLFNNLFWRGTIDSFDSIHPPLWTFQDNLFDQCTNEVLTYTTNVLSNNAYVTTNFGVWIYSSNDVVLSTSPAYQSGALGGFYYPASLTNLIHTGSRLASAAGLYHYTVLTNAYSIEGTNIVSIGFHYIAVDANGNPLDSNGDGLPDYVKDSNGDGVYDSGDLANWLSPFNIYDQGTTLEGWTPPYLRLGYWRFNNTSWTNEAGVGPTTQTNLYSSNSFSGTSVSLTNSNSQLIYSVTNNGTNYFNPANGTIRFWFQPNWSTGGSSGEPNFVNFFEASGSAIGFLQLVGAKVNDTNGRYIGSIIQFITQSNLYKQQYSFQDGSLNGVLFNFQSNHWYQMTLTYSPTNVALYTNGVLLATANTPPWLLTNGGSDLVAPLFQYGNGNIFSPPVSDFATRGLSVGNEWGGGQPLMGQLDELETFNYPLTAQQVAAGFPTFGGNATNMLDTYYIGRSDMLQTYVDGFPHPSATNLVPCRLGYWRFDSPLLYGEQGQVPLSITDVGQTPSWSGTALNIGSATNSEVTYPDVGSNGWANINCQQGSLRFWFKENGTATTYPAPFIYMGGPNTSNEWSLEQTIHHSISFVTQPNLGSPEFILGPTVVSCLSTSNWTQIVLTYGPTNCDLYTNGVLAASGTGNTNYPTLSNRHYGMVIGNNSTSSASLNGQFEEMETFNYKLAASDILANFEIVSNVDSNLNGIPDLLEDIHLGTGRPFLGAPVVITGTIEAEQFDMGGPGVGYYNTVSNPPSSYRPTGLVITNCDDLGGGYCLDQMRSNDWAQYTINVLVAQAYVIETRVAGIGSTGGVFRCEFTNSSGFNTNTGPMTIPTTTWTIVTNVVYLQSGINVMKLHCLTNGPGATNVGRFNYISIYPWWTNGNPGSYVTNISTASLFTNTNSWSAAVSNAAVIQAAINSLTNGGTVEIPEGTWYVSQAVPNDASDAFANAVACITNSNITITGVGTNATNTVLIANNRSTTMFVLGQSHGGSRYLCTNFILSDLTLEAQPHEVAFTNTNPPYGYTNFYELGQLNLNGGMQGSLAVFLGWSNNQLTVNISISNCVFLHGIKSLVPDQYISNFMVVNCQFIPTDANCYFIGTTNAGAPGTTNAWTSNTTWWQTADVAIFGGGPFNAVIVSNSYIGNSSLTTTNTNVISTNVVAGQTNILAPDGFVWFETSGNVFVARNTISNNELEAVQLNAGPNAVVGNTFGTLVNDGSCCALNFNTGGQNGVTGTTNPVNNSTCFIGNSVYGGRSGEEGVQSTSPFILNFSGNSLNLYLPFDSTNDWPGGALWVQNCQAANVCGNTLVRGTVAFSFEGSNTSALILNNNFSGATYRGIGYGTIGDCLTTAQIYGNTLSQGVSFHVQLPYTNSFGWFMGSNTNVTTNMTAVPLFTDPASSAIHIYN